MDSNAYLFSDAENITCKVMIIFYPGSIKFPSSIHLPEIVLINIKTKS